MGRAKRLPILRWFLCALSFYVLSVLISFFGLDSSLTPGLKSVFSDAKSLLSNVIISFVFYYLVVYLPERRKRQIIRANFRKMYRDTKREILYDIISGSVRGGRTDIDTGGIDEMMKPEGFKKTFEGGREADEGFYAFTNFVMRDEEAFRAIIFKFKLIARQLEYILANVQFDDEAAFRKLKRLEEGLFELDGLHADYDHVKVLDRVIWAIFAGWSSIEGYQGFDFVERAIDEI